ncbi:MAG TPA: N-acetylmuramoyl-L-alanine amidase [Terriglobales bacterium]|nr:N-acetylmuramoyl-L-alanine amidase [Terriglobales bacterium]
MAGNEGPQYRANHRVRMRPPAALLPDWDFFQALLAFAFTVQQENQKLRGEISRLARERADADEGEGIHVALTRIVASAQNLTAASGAALALGTEEAMVCVARSGRIAPEMGSSVPLEQGLAAECARTRKSVLCVNATGDPRVNPISSRALGVSSMLYVPLQAQDELIGILGLFSERPSHFASSDLQLLRYIAALVLEQLHKQSPLLQAITPRVLVETIKSSAPAIVEKEPEPAPRPVDEGSASEIRASIKGSDAAPLKPKATATVSVRAPSPTPPGKAIAPDIKLEPAPVPTEEVFHDTLIQNDGSNVALITTVLLVLLLGSLGGGYYMRHHAPPIKMQAPETETQKPATPETKTVPSTAPAGSLELGRSLMPGLRYWMSDGRAMVTIVFGKEVTYDSVRLHDPERIYFDLHGFEFGGPKDKAFDINDNLLRRIRVGLLQPGTTRIVFDLAQPLSYTATESRSPDGLVIDFESKRSVSSPTSTLASPEPESTVAPHALTVVIDPGHGGRDTGTIGHNGLEEKRLTLDVAKRLGKLLEENLGAHVLYTRKDDHYVSLENRSAVAKKANSDFFISIHANSSQFPMVNGVETYYFKSSSEVIENVTHDGHRGTDSSDRARRFAAAVQQALIQNLSTKQVSIRDRGVRTAPFVVLRDMQMPAVLAEISFISSEAGEQQLRTSAYRDRIANALYQGIAHNVLPKSPEGGSVAALTHGSASAP